MGELDSSSVGNLAVYLCIWFSFMALVAMGESGHV